MGITKREVLKALRKSQSHWHRFATGKAREDESIYGRDCACCKLFSGCYYCPLLNRELFRRLSANFMSGGCCDGKWLQASRCHRSYGVHSNKFLIEAKEVEKFIRRKTYLINKLGRKWKDALK